MNIFFPIMGVIVSAVSDFSSTPADGLGTVRDTPGSRLPESAPSLVLFDPSIGSYMYVGAFRTKFAIVLFASQSAVKERKRG